MNMFGVGNEGDSFVGKLGMSLNEPKCKLISKVYELFDLYCHTEDINSINNYVYTFKVGTLIMFII